MVMHRRGGEKRELTVPTILKYRPQAKRREISDSTKGLRLVIHPTGGMTWIMRLRRPNGKSAKLTLGPVDLSGRETIDEKTGKPITPKIGMPLSLSNARWLAAEINSQRASDIDVVVETKADKRRKLTDAADRATNTFGTVIREFFVKHKTKKWNTRPRRWRDDAATLGLRYPKATNPPGGDPATEEPEVIKGSLAETWADKPIADIDKYQVEAVVDEARKHGSDSRARKLYSVLSVLFGWLPLKYRIAANPMIGVKRPGPPASRDRKLDETEIVLFWKACEAIDKPAAGSTERGIFGALYQALLLTGCRLREPARMARAELGDNGVWEVPADRTKNHLPFLVPLPQSALDIINAISTTGGSNSGLVFTTNGKTPVSGFSKAKKALDAAMVKIAGKPIKPWRTHDLRRTFSTIMNESPDDGGLGIAPHIVESCLNHISGGAKSGVAGVYNKARYLSEKRVAFERWANHVEGLVSGRRANVTSIRRKKDR